MWFSNSHGYIQEVNWLALNFGKYTTISMDLVLHILNKR